MRRVWGIQPRAKTPGSAETQDAMMCSTTLRLAFCQRSHRMPCAESSIANVKPTDIRYAEWNS